jgi:hypothetical protein
MYLDYHNPVLMSDQSTRIVVARALASKASDQGATALSGRWSMVILPTMPKLASAGEYSLRLDQRGPFLLEPAPARSRLLERGIRARLQVTCGLLSIYPLDKAGPFDHDAAIPWAACRRGPTACFEPTVSY